MKQSSVDKDVSKPSAARKKFLDAARKEFAAKGYAGASIRAITRSLGVRESAFYAHFASKQVAYDELFREGGPDVVLSLSNGLDTTQPMAEQLLALANAAMAEWTSSEGRFSTSLLLREAFGDDASKRTQLLQGVSAAMESLTAVFLKYQRTGAIRRDIDVQILGYQFVAPLITARLLFFNPNTTKADHNRGNTLVRNHVKNFCTAVSVQPTRTRTGRG